MIQAKELRIGNLVHIVDPSAGFVEAEISAGAIYDISEMERLGKPMPYAPIELTEEWLYLFGFKAKNGVYTLDRSTELGHPFGNFSVSFYDSTQMKCWRGDRYIGVVPNLQYVHQLQNLFYALTGQELEIKEKP